METRTIETSSREETFLLGRTMGEMAGPGAIFAVNGDLGCGKTVFSQGFASGLGIDEVVNSPTFTIIQEYDTGRFPFYHFDVYRVGSASGMEEIGIDEYLYGNGVCLIEWADMITEILPEHYTRVTITKDLTKDFDFRKIKVEVF